MLNEETKNSVGWGECAGCSDEPTNLRPAGAIPKGSDTDKTDPQEAKTTPNQQRRSTKADRGTRERSGDQGYSIVSMQLVAGFVAVVGLFACGGYLLQGEAPPATVSFITFASLVLAAADFTE